MRKSVFENMPKKTGEQIVIISQVRFSLSLNSIATIMPNPIELLYVSKNDDKLTCYLLIVYIGAGVRG